MVAAVASDAGFLSLRWAARSQPHVAHARRSRIAQSPYCQPEMKQATDKRAVQLWHAQPTMDQTLGP
jgi:hypothetical protein